MRWCSVAIAAVLGSCVSCGGGDGTGQVGVAPDTSSSAETTPDDVGGADTIVDSSSAETSLPDSSSDSVVDAPADVADVADVAEAEACSPPDGAGCSVFPQCGCKSGEKCDVISSSGTTGCGPAGAGGKNAHCFATDACAPGLACVGDVCLPYCTKASDCVSAGATCYSVEDSSTPPKAIPGFTVCGEKCDPVVPAAACGSVACRKTKIGTTCKWLDKCAVTGSYCKADEWCMPTATGESCHRICSPPTTICPSGQTCKTTVPDPGWLSCN